ncbi:protein NPAT isoform X2 [Erythrolamprus reginae]|uniref:protein NPAT isoform X2 n=1 Tax=Erythrolamprus reginae TaxID=121349 RepID=UPI00396C91E3
MLLPSDVARLVLGYLQQEKLLATCRAFILESSDLKEYAEHCTGEGFVPACLLSLFGKNLTTILNEYIAMKSKETTNDIPAIMSSLWKKLDYTLSQIRSMQNSVGFSANQRSRTRSAIADMKKQKCLQQSASSNLGSSPAVYQPGQLTSTAITATQVILKPVISSSLAQPRLNPPSALQGQIQESQIHMCDSLTLVSALQERKLNTSVLSPGKRKSDSQKKRSNASGPQLSNCSIQESSPAEKVSLPMQEESEQLELIDGDLPQMIIENAREKILSSKCLQEKLAENINKFLGSDGNMPQTAKQAESGPPIQESSIDEFLGLQQGEIHMTEEAIQEILEQTESDPAFQGLFDVFDFGKTKNCRNVSQGISTQNGTDNSMLVDEENLEALESYIGTKELGDNSHESLSYTDDHSKEACVLKTSCSEHDFTLEQHLKIQSIVSGEFSSSSEVRNQSESVEMETPDQRIEPKFTSESVQNQFPGTEPNIDACNKQGPATRNYRTEKDGLCQGVQNLPDLPYNQLDTSQTALSDKTECCSLPNMLSEKTNAEVLAPLKSYESETVNKPSVNCSHSKEMAENVQQVTDQSVFPVSAQRNRNSPSSSNFQDSNKLESEHSATLVVEASHPNVVELQLEVVGTSNSLNLNDPAIDPEPCSKYGNQKLEDSEIAQVEIQEPSSSSPKADAKSLFLTADNDRPTETAIEANATTSSECRSPLLDPTGETSPGNKIAEGVSSSNQGIGADASNIVSLKIIISDDPFISSDTELNNAVSSITGENVPTIILSSPAKSPSKMTRTSKSITAEESEKPGDSALVEHNLLVLRSQESGVSSLNIQNEDCAVFSVAGTSNISKDGEFIQLMPATSTSFGSSNSVYIASCISDPTALSTNVTPSNLVMFPGSSTSLASHIPMSPQLQTPPRTNSLFAMNPSMSPNYSQGSAIIIASPVQPVLQGMVGMIPVSIMGQNGNALSDPSRQILHMPVHASLSSGSIPKLPLPPKFHRMPRSKSNGGGKPVLNGSEPGSRVQRTGNSDKNICGDLKKTIETLPADTTSPSSKQNGSHRRVLCFDTTQASQKEKNENSKFCQSSSNTVLSSTKTQPSKRERERTLPRILCKPDITSKNLAVKESQLEKKGSGPGVASDILRKQTANKENELERSLPPQTPEMASLSNNQQSLHHEKNCSSAQEVTKKPRLQPKANNKNAGVLPSKEFKKEQAKSPSQVNSLTGPLTKQAVEMLYDIQRHSPASKLPENGELPLPRTPSGTSDRHSDDTFDIRTPTCKRYSEDSTTPRIMVPPATPDLPACSPASETGSENSVSMAAHTLMILSRAAIARTSTTTPLKDNTQQFKSIRSAAKKRKQEDSVDCEKNSRTPNKKDAQNFALPIKKKKIKKKLPIAFPAEMDVDKFLLSLHYDE